MDALRFTVNVTDSLHSKSAITEVTIIIVELELPHLSVSFPDSYNTQELNYYE